MSRFWILSIISISILQFACRNESIKPIPFYDICRTTIDSTLSFDHGLNDGDTLFIEFPKASDLAENTKKRLNDYIHEKYNLKVVESNFENLTWENDTLTPARNLKGFYLGIQSIETVGKKKIIIESKKYKGMLASIIVETIFEYKNGNWICTQSRITSIS